MKRSMVRKLMLLVTCVLAVVLTTSCAGNNANAKKGAVIGGVLGAAAGGVIGHQSGRGLEGAAIGGAAGAAAGGLYGSSKDDEAKQWK